MGSSDVTAEAPPSQTVSKKKRSYSNTFKDAHESAYKKKQSVKALVHIQTLPERQYAHEGRVINHERNFAKKAEESYNDKKWNDFLDNYDEEETEDISVGNGFRGMVKTETMKVGGERSKFNSNKVTYAGTAIDKLENELFDRDVKKAKRSCINVGNNLKDFDKIDDDEVIIDADYENIYKTVPPRDVRDVGFGRPKRQEPAAMKAISQKKQSIKSQVTNLASPKNRVEEGSALVSATKMISGESLMSKPSMKEKPTLVKTRDLVDEGFDALVDVGKGIAGIGRTVAGAGIAGIGTGFKAIDKGATAFGNSTIGQNIKAQNEADYKHMRSHGFRAAESIKATGRNGRKVGMTAGSLVTQKGRNIRFNESSSGNVGAEENLTIHGFTARYVKGHRGHIDLQWSYKGSPVEFADAKKYLTADEISKLRKTANGIFKGHISFGSRANKGVPTVTKNRNGYGLVNNTKIAIGGLVKQHTHRMSRNTDYSYEPSYEPTYESTYGNNKTVAGLITAKTGTDGLKTMKTHSDVVNKTATATPSKIISKAGNADKTVTVGLAFKRNSIVSKPKNVTVGSIVTQKRNAGGTAS
jgi:hypothetical protein